MIIVGSSEVEFDLQTITESVILAKISPIHSKNIIAIVRNVVLDCHRDVSVPIHLCLESTTLIRLAFVVPYSNGIGYLVF